MPRILILENDVGLAKTWSRALESEGHEVRVCDDTLAALDAIDEARPELAITEILLPGLGGVAFTGQAKLRDPAIKVIAVTGDPAALDANVGALALARRVGADLLLAKPFETDVLVVAVNRLLSES
jgi:CheY-like chemotaxis protein